MSIFGVILVGEVRFAATRLLLASDAGSPSDLTMLSARITATPVPRI